MEIVRWPIGCIGMIAAEWRMDAGTSGPIGVECVLQMHVVACRIAQSSVLIQNLQLMGRTAEYTSYDSSTQWRRVLWNNNCSSSANRVLTERASRARKANILVAMFPKSSVFHLGYIVYDIVGDRISLDWGPIYTHMNSVIQAIFWHLLNKFLAR